MMWYVIKYALSCHEYHAVLQLSYRCTRLGAWSALRLWKMVRGARHWKSRPRQRTAPSPLSMTSWAWDSEMKRMTCVPCTDMKTSPISYALIYLFTYSTLYTVYCILYTIELYEGSIQVSNIKKSNHNTSIHLRGLKYEKCLCLLQGKNLLACCQQNLVQRFFHWSPMALRESQRVSESLSSKLIMWKKKLQIQISTHVVAT